MAKYYASQWRKTSVAARSGSPVVNRHVWDNEAKADGDKIVVGILPAGHRLVPELCSVIQSAGGTANNVDLCVDSDANVLLNNQAHVADTFTRTGITAYSAAEDIGVSDDNREIYFLLNTAPTDAGGQLIATIASKPD